jgi:esterase/lipase superfamily enzyme
LRLFLISFFILLTACADRLAVPVSDGPVAGGDEQTILVASLRDSMGTDWFTGERAETLSFLDVDVAIPPERDTGQLRLHRHANVDPAKYFTITDRQDYDSRRAFSRAIQNQMKDVPRDQQDLVIYVHGYNNSFADGVFRAAQMAHDFDITGAMLHFSWPSAANSLGYTYDRDSVLYSRDGLEETLRAAADANPRRIILIGHSLGTMLVMETLRQIEIKSPGWADRTLGGVVLISPDLDVDLFQAQARRFAELPQPFVIFVSNKDRALQLSAMINGYRPRLGGLESAEELSEFPLTLIDVSEFAEGLGPQHFTVGTSPALIKILGAGSELQSAFDEDRAARSGLLPGTVITAQRATQVILSPLLLTQ